MPPVLAIPLNAKVEEFERQMNVARQGATRAARAITDEFIKSNREIVSGVTAATGAIAREHALAAAKTIAAWAAPRAAILIGAKLLADAMMNILNAVRDQMAEIIKISDLASKAMAGTDFAQAFLSEARKMKVTTQDLAGALEKSFDALKDKVDDTWKTTDDVPKKLDKIGDKMRELRDLFSEKQNPIGVQLFQDANTLDEKRIAVLTFMRELEDIGQRLVALDLGESVFGSKFADSIRRGETSAQSMLDSLQNAPRYAQQLVAETKEIDTQLKAASDRMERSFQPSFDAAVVSANAMKSLFTDIVQLIARAGEALGEFQPKVIAFLAQAAKAFPTFGPVITALELASKFGGGSVPAPNIPGAPSNFTGFNVTGLTGSPIPLPRRRPPEAPEPPKEKKEAEEVADAWDRATDSIQKHTTQILADAAAVGQTEAKHQQLRVELRLLEAASEAFGKISDEQIQKYAEARKTLEPVAALQAAGITLTKEQAAEFENLSHRIGDVVTAAGKAKGAFQGLNDSIRYAGNELINVIDRAAQKSATFGDIMKDVLRSVSRELLRAALIGEGAFAKMLGLSSSVAGGTGGLGGVLAGLLGSIGGTGGGVLPGGVPIGQGGIGHAAGGGYVPPGGLSYVGEHGPNPRLIRAGSQGIFVTPNEPMGGGGGGGFNNFTKIELNAQGADAAAVRRLESLVAGLNASIEDRSRAAFMDDRRRRMKT